MNGKDIFRDLKKSYKPQRNGFDQEQRSIFTVKVGQKLPVFTQETLPGGSYYIDPMAIYETINPFQTKAYIRLRTVMDFYFFPYAYSNTIFNQFIVGRKDNTLRTQIGKDLVDTHFNLFNFLRFVLTSYGFCYATGTDGLHLNSDITNETMADLCHLQISPNSCLPSDVIRNLDMLGFGNYLPLVKIVEQYLADQLADTPRSSFAIYEMLAVDEYNDSRTFIEYLLLNLTNLAVFKYDGPDDVPPDFSDLSLFTFKKYNLHAPAAYNRVFDAFVRNSYYTDSLVVHTWSVRADDWYLRQSFDFAELFNFDQITEFDTTDLYPQPHGDEAGHLANNDALMAIFGIKPATHFKDMFTGIMPDSQFGDVSVMMDDRSWLNLQVSDGSNTYTVDKTVGASNSRALAFGDSQTPSFNNPKLRFDPALAISVLEQRKANALQRFRERQMRAGNRTSDNFDVHYGVKPYSNTDMLPTYLGSFEGSLTPNPVVATAEAGDYSVGSRAAYGVGTVEGKKIELNTNDFGVIIGILSIVPYDDYNSFMIDKAHSKLDQFDYMFPEFDDLGFQAASLDDFSIYGYRGEGWKQDVIRGYLMRYYDHKMANDKVHGELYRGFYPRYSNFFADYLSIVIKKYYSGAFSHYVSARPTLNPLEESFLYVQINELDSVFGFAADAHQVTDQFICNINFNSDSIQPLSVLGLPY